MTQSTLHVAIIMDGNGRWAQKLGMPRYEGHCAGAESLRRIVEASPSLGVGTLTAYAFSSDNWKRPAEEVEALMQLLASYLRSETPSLLANGVRRSVIGRRDRLPRALLSAMESAEQRTAGCERMHLRLAIDYSAREAILRATQLCGGASVTAEHFEQLLGTPNPVDLLIRTGGEQRLSDFLLWECAYAELVFTPRMWPDFDSSDLKQALKQYHRRERRFGGVMPPPAPATSHERWLR
jgi:undecaprenyl diphosphate synthase